MNLLYQWLTMGKYSIYVWPAYGLVAGTFLINYLLLRRHRRLVMQRLKQQFRGQTS